MKKVCGLLIISLSFLIFTLAFAEQEFILNSSYSPPHSTEDQTGYLDLILKEAFKRAMFEAHIQMMPAERCLQDSNAGVSDGEIGRIRQMSQFYPNLVIVDEPILESRDFVAFSKNYEFPTPDWKSLQPYHVGIVRGWKIMETNVTDVRSLIKMESTRSLFKLLKNDRADVVLNARIDGLYAAKQIGMENVKVMEPPLASLDLYLFMHKKNAWAIPKLEAALRDMKSDGSFYQIRRNVLKDMIGK